MCVRGLKHFKKYGAGKSVWSHAVCVRGLKLLIHQQLFDCLCRTPCACVDWNIYFNFCFVNHFRRTPCACVDWNIKPNMGYSGSIVARRVRAWIETSWNGWKIREGLSHAVCVRGLKQLMKLNLTTIRSRTPCACVDWNKGISITVFEASTSHAVCVRGLKLTNTVNLLLVVFVARRVRAWIETSLNFLFSSWSWSHAVCVRGLKLCNVKKFTSIFQVARRVRAWIETTTRRAIAIILMVARRVRAWIETLSLVKER